MIEETEQKSTIETEGDREEYSTKKTEINTNTEETYKDKTVISHVLSNLPMDQFLRVRFMRPRVWMSELWPHLKKEMDNEIKRKEWLKFVYY